jgi:hypothetical protein
LIAGTGNPVPGQLLKYEIIWVNDNEYYLELIWTSFAYRQKHRISVNDKSLSIEYVNPINQQHENLYLDLIR